MLTLRCTRKLQKVLGVKAADVSIAPTTALGDWYGDSFGARHRRLAIFMSDRSLLPVIVEQRDLRNLFPALHTAFAELLRRLKVPTPLIESEIHEMEEARLGPTRSRSVLASMNDMKRHARWLLTTQDPTLLGLELDLSEVPCGPLGYRSPREVTVDLLRRTR